MDVKDFCAKQPNDAKELFEKICKDAGLNPLSISSNYESDLGTAYTLLDEYIENKAIPNVIQGLGVYTCFKCKSKDTTHQEMITRRADESSSFKIFCRNCSNEWTEGS